MTASSRKIQRAAQREVAKAAQRKRTESPEPLIHSQPLPPLQPLFVDFTSTSRQVPSEPTHMGIFCDCYGTLYSDSFKCNELLVDYLNAKHAAGTPVQLISTDTKLVRDKISDIGLHPDIVRSLTTKRLYQNNAIVLEELIDDDPVILNAQTLRDPKDEACREHMRAFLARHQAPAPNPA